MAIRSMNDAIAARKETYFYSRAHFLTAAQRWYDGWAGASGTFDTTLAGVTLDSGNGVIGGMVFPFRNPTPSPDSAETYLARMTACNGGAFGLYVLADRLWHNGGFSATSTGVQTVNSPTWPARDEDGATLGHGVQIGLTTSGAMGGGSPNITLTYTNTAGVTGRQVTIAGVASAGAHSHFIFPLVSGDNGVKIVESLQLSATWNSGTMNLVAYRRISQIENSSTGYANEIDLLAGGMPQLYNGTVPFWLFESASANSTYTFSNCFTIIQG
jgi:hypothetical protein